MPQSPQLLIYKLLLVKCSYDADQSMVEPPQRASAGAMEVLRKKHLFPKGLLETNNYDNKIRLAVYLFLVKIVYQIL